MKTLQMITCLCSGNNNPDSNDSKFFDRNIQMIKGPPFGCKWSSYMTTHFNVKQNMTMIAMETNFNLKQNLMKNYLRFPLFCLRWSPCDNKCEPESDQKLSKTHYLAQMIAMMTNSDPTAAVASVAIKKAGELLFLYDYQHVKLFVIWK